MSKSCWRLFLEAEVELAIHQLLDLLQRAYRVALVHLATERSLCIDRVVSRGPERNISHTTDRERMGRHYDLWQERVLPTYRFALSVDGDDVEGAIAAIRGLLRSA